MKYLKMKYLSKHSWSEFSLKMFYFISETIHFKIFRSNYLWDLSCPYFVHTVVIAFVIQFKLGFLKEMILKVIRE